MQAEAEIEKSTEERFIMVDDIRAKGSEGLSKGSPLRMSPMKDSTAVWVTENFPGNKKLRNVSTPDGKNKRTDRENRRRHTAVIL